MNKTPKYFLRMPHGMTLDVDQTGFTALTALEAGMATVMLNKHLDFVQVERKKDKDTSFVIFTVRPTADSHVGVEMSANEPDDHEKLAYQLAGRGWNDAIIDVVKGV